MHSPFHGGKLSSPAMDECAVCQGRIALSLVEPHPVYEGWEIHTYACKECEATSSRIVACPSNAGAPPLAARRS